MAGSVLRLCLHAGLLWSSTFERLLRLFWRWEIGKGGDGWKWSRGQSENWYLACTGFLPVYLTRLEATIFEVCSSFKTVLKICGSRNTHHCQSCVELVTWSVGWERQHEEEDWVLEVPTSWVHGSASTDLYCMVAGQMQNAIQPYCIFHSCTVYCVFVTAVLLWSVWYSDLPAQHTGNKFKFNIR